MLVRLNVAVGVCLKFAQLKIRHEGPVLVDTGRQILFLYALQRLSCTRLLECIVSAGTYPWQHHA